MQAIEAFETLDLRVGRVLRAEVNERARKPAYRLWIDFGPLGERTSSAQLRARYSVEDLVGRLVIAAVNLGARNIAGFTSEVLVLGGRRQTHLRALDLIAERHEVKYEPMLIHPGEQPGE